MRMGLILGIAAAAAVIGFIYWQGNGGAPVDAARVTRGEIREFIDEQAITRLAHTHLITMPYNGRVEAIDLAEGTTISAGQIVARVVPSDLQLKVAAAQAAVDRLGASIRENDDTTVESTALEQALRFVESMDATVQAAQERVKAGEAKLTYANTHLRRIRSLRETGAATEDQFNEAEVNQVQAAVDYQTDTLVLSALRSMQAATVLVPTLVRQYIERKKLSRAVLEEERAEAESRLSEARRDQERGVMKSPVDGVVLERQESNEREIAAGTVLLKIGQPNHLEVEADVLSQDVVRVRDNDPVEIYGPALGDFPATGKVTRIYPSGFTKTSSLGVEQQRVKVVVGLAPADAERLRNQQRLGIGYRVRVKIFTAESPDALVVPRSALFRGPTGGWQTFVIRGGKARLQAVEVGLMNDERVELTRGVAEDEAVILAPESNLTDGTAVRATGLDAGA